MINFILLSKHKSYVMHKKKMANLGYIICNQKVALCLFFFFPSSAAQGGFGACSLINCKLLLGYHSKISWVETNSKTLLQFQTKMIPNRVCNQAQQRTNYSLPLLSCTLKKKFTTDVQNGHENALVAEASDG